MPVIFQGRQEDLPTYEETREILAMAIGSESEIFRAARSSLVHVTSRRGESGDAPDRMGVPFPVRWGSL